MGCRASACPSLPASGFPPSAQAQVGSFRPAVPPGFAPSAHSGTHSDRKRSSRPLPVLPCFAPHACTLPADSRGAVPPPVTSKPHPRRFLGRPCRHRAQHPYPRRFRRLPSGTAPASQPSLLRFARSSTASRQFGSSCSALHRHARRLLWLRLTPARPSCTPPGVPSSNGRRTGLPG